MSLIPALGRGRWISVTLWPVRDYIVRYCDPLKRRGGVTLTGNVKDKYEIEIKKKRQEAVVMYSPLIPA